MLISPLYRAVLHGARQCSTPGATWQVLLLPPKIKRVWEQRLEYAIVSIPARYNYSCIFKRGLRGGVRGKYCDVEPIVIDDVGGALRTKQVARPGPTRMVIPGGNWDTAHAALREALPALLSMWSCLAPAPAREVFRCNEASSLVSRPL